MYPTSEGIMINTRERVVSVKIIGTHNTDKERLRPKKTMGQTFSSVRKELGVSCYLHLIRY